METRRSNKSNLEYNDGLGDLLREKQRRQFSWAKTIVVLIATIFIIFMALTLAFNLGKSFFNRKPTVAAAKVAPVGHAPEAEESYDSKIDKIEKENLELIGQIEKSLNDTPTPKVEAPAPQVKKAPVSKPKPVVVVAAPKYSYKVIAGSFQNKENAAALSAELSKKGVSAYIYKVIVNGKTLYRVQIGAYATNKEAVAFKAALAKKGIESSVVSI